MKKIFSFSSINSVLAKCRSLVETFKHSTTLSEKLANVIKSVNGKLPELELDSDDLELIEEYETLLKNAEFSSDKSLRTKLVQDMVVRWNSTLMMLTSIFEAHGSIRIVICNDSITKSNYQHELLSENELNIVEDLYFYCSHF